MLISILFTLQLASLAAHAQRLPLAEGDIIFQSNVSPQCKAIELATRSKYSHCGLLFKKGNGWYVLEAVQPVRETPLQEWVARDRHYEVKRLLNSTALLTPAVVSKMKTEGAKYLGRNYDAYFEWSDERIYCSELVWKVYREVVGLEVGWLQPLREYDLSHPVVKAAIAERYGSKVPLNEKMISPGNIYNSPLLKTVVVR